MTNKDPSNQKQAMDTQHMADDNLRMGYSRKSLKIRKTKPSSHTKMQLYQENVGILVTT